ncbi:MAG: glycoside hydrolase family 32 protein [Chitinophagaceae bacterium]
MKKLTYIIPIIFFIACNSAEKQADKQPDKQLSYNEPYRPQIHFSPKEKWMNDPNGMVFFNGTYHLFYQYYPDSTVWGPMHWGHATSKDLVHWENQPVALYPDSLGYIFSGSAVVDSNNTSGFGKDGKIPLVAIFTHHDPKGEKAGTSTYQNQSIAYSLDEGKTWVKYANNPVLKNPGIKDFRDPKVNWYEAGKKWIMTLATLDRITFYSSPNLKDWKKESEFGKEVGAHGGVWECPDLFTLNYNGKPVWILIVNINPGGPNGGSATQYFTGQFDGNKFTPYQTDTRWLDYGPDEYAGITWSNTGSRRIFLGWMSNWQYANKVPTEKWRSAMTVPRDLGIEKLGDKYLVTSQPSKELNVIEEKPVVVHNISGTDQLTTGGFSGPARFSLTSDKLESFAITLSNDAGEKVVIGYDKDAKNYFIDRTNSGNVSFEKGFAGKHTAPRFSDKDSVDLTLIIDNASVELFADNGLTVMTEIFFPGSLLSNYTIKSRTGFKIKSLSVTELKSIW